MKFDRYELLEMSVLMVEVVSQGAIAMRQDSVLKQAFAGWDPI